MKMTPIFLSLTFFASSVALAVQETNGLHHGNPGPSLDTAFRIANFAMLAVILFFLLRKPVAEYFANRSAALKMSVDEAGEAYAVALRQNGEMAKRLENLEKESREMLKTFRQEAESEKVRLINQAVVFSERLKEDVKKIAVGETRKAREELKGMAIAMSKNIAEQIIKKEMTEDDCNRLAGNYLERLKRLN